MQVATDIVLPDQVRTELIRLFAPGVYRVVCAQPPLEIWPVQRSGIIG